MLVPTVLSACALLHNGVTVVHEARVPDLPCSLKFKNRRPS